MLFTKEDREALARVEKNLLDHCLTYDGSDDPGIQKIKDDVGTLIHVCNKINDVIIPTLNYLDSKVREIQLKSGNLDLAAVLEKVSALDVRLTNLRDVANKNAEAYIVRAADGQKENQRLNDIYESRWRRTESYWSETLCRIGDIYKSIQEMKDAQSKSKPEPRESKAKTKKVKTKTKK